MATKTKNEKTPVHPHFLLPATGQWSSRDVTHNSGRRYRCAQTLVRRHIRSRLGHGRVQHNQQEDHQSLATNVGPRVVHRNRDGTPYCDCAILTSTTNQSLVVAAVDTRGRLDLIRMPASSSSSSSMVQHVQLSDSSECMSYNDPFSHKYTLFSFQQGQAMAIGMPSGDFHVLATDHLPYSQRNHSWTQQSGHAWHATNKASTSQIYPPQQQQQQPSTTSHVDNPCRVSPTHNSSRPSSSCNNNGYNPYYWTHSWIAYGPQRKYAPCPQWTLSEQFESRHKRRVDDTKWMHLEERLGWDQRSTRSNTGTVVSTPVASSWDFCETPSTLMAVHVGNNENKDNYVGVKLLDDRIDRSHVLVAIPSTQPRPRVCDLENNDPLNFATRKRGTAPPNHDKITAAVFASQDGRLLATNGGSSSCHTSNNHSSSDAVLLWDLRMTQQPMESYNSAVALPSFPRDAAHGLHQPVSSWWSNNYIMDQPTTAVKCVRRRYGRDTEDVGQGRSVELPALDSLLSRKSACDDHTAYDDSAAVRETRSRLISMSALDCAMISYKLRRQIISMPSNNSCSLSSLPIVALHPDGWVAQVDSALQQHNGTTHTNPIDPCSSKCGLYVRDVAQSLVELHKKMARRTTVPLGPRQLRHNSNKKRAADGTLLRLFDGTRKDDDENENDVEDARRRHDLVPESGVPPKNRNAPFVPLPLEDRYGCSTTPSCLAFGMDATRLVGGTHDGDLFVVEF